MLRVVVQMLVTQGSGLGWMLPHRFRVRSREDLRFTVLVWASRAQLRLFCIALLVPGVILEIATSGFATTVIDQGTYVYIAP